MPRAAKASNRQRINASIEYKKGNRKEAYALWEKAAAARKERLDAKRYKRKRASEAAAAAEAADAAKKAEAEAKAAEKKAAESESDAES